MKLYTLQCICHMKGFLQKNNWREILFFLQGQNYPYHGYERLVLNSRGYPLIKFGAENLKLSFFLLHGHTRYPQKSKKISTTVVLLRGFSLPGFCTVVDHHARNYSGVSPWGSFR